MHEVNLTDDCIKEAEKNAEHAPNTGPTGT